MKKTYITALRRRKEGRTDYRARLRLLKSNKPRFVARKSANNISCQIIEYLPKGDKVLVSINAVHLRQMGWKAHTGNVPAAYLIGYLCGLKAKRVGVKEAVFDAGLYRSTRGSRLYAALKGLIDSGINVPHSKEILPSEDRIAGKDIAKYAEKLKKENPAIYEKEFSSYLKNHLPPESLPAHFAEIKQKIFHVKEVLAK